MQAGGTLTRDVPVPAPGHVTPHVQPDWVVDADGVQGRAPGTLLIDSRAAPRYRGDAEPIDPRAGHVPGAVNRDWAGSLDAGGGWRAPDEQARRLAVGDAPVIVYCGSGVSGAANLLALSLAGRPPGPDVQLYAGSWSDWSSDPARPAEVGDPHAP